MSALGELPPKSVNYYNIPQDHFGVDGIKLANKIFMQLSQIGLKSVYDLKNRRIIILDSSKLTIYSLPFQLLFHESKNKDHNKHDMDAVESLEPIYRKENSTSNILMYFRQISSR